MNALPLPPQDSAVTLARIEVKLDNALRQADDHEGRLRALESRNDGMSQARRTAVSLWVSAAATVAAVVSLLAGFVR